jgi:hypothetical protein
MDKPLLDLHFHKVGAQSAQPRWKGRVMAQLSNEIYMVSVWELDDMNKPDLPCLKLARIDQMLPWCFFEDEHGVQADLAKRAWKPKAERASGDR